MKKNLFLTLIWVIGFSFKGFSQNPCINIGVVPPVLCPGNSFDIPYVLVPPDCCTDIIRAELDTITGNFNCPASFPPGKNYRIFSNSTIVIPVSFTGKYKVRLVCGGPCIKPSVAKNIQIDPLDFSPRPFISITQISPVRPSYCPTDTLKFKVNVVSGAGPGFTINWGRNGTLSDGNIDSIFSYTDLIDNDVFYGLVTKQSRCALFATATSDTFKIKVSKKPKVKIILAPGSTGCELTSNTFIARPDSAELNPTYIWTRVVGSRIDTLSQGVNDSIFTLSPSDSSTFGSQVCVEIISSRCKLKANDCYTIKACGQVFIDPPLVPEICAGNVLKVPYTTKGSFLPANVFKVQLSDSLGNFSSPIDIGTLVSNKPDTIRALIPAISKGGNFFRVRIISSQPIDTSDTSAVFKVFPKPIPPVTVSDSVCKSGLVSLSASSLQPGSVFNWYSGPFGGSSVFTGVSKTINISRDTVFYVSSTSSQGCESDRTPVRGIINPSPNVEAGSDLNKCVGDGPVTLTPFPLGGMWSGALPVVNNIINLSGVTPGIYTLYYEVTNSLGCSTIDSLKLTLSPFPVVRVGADTSFCSNVSPFQFFGSPAGGSWSGTGVQSDGTFVPSAVGSGIFPLIYSVTVNGCSATDTLKVSVNLAPPIFTVTTVDPTACNLADGSATLAGITTGPGFKVKWSVNRADSLSDPTITNLDAGAYTVRVTDLATGCRRLGAFGLSDPNAPEPIISGLQANYCSSDPCVTINVVPNSPTGTWSGTGVNGNTFCPAQAALGANIVVYSYDTTGGCTGTTSILVRVNQSPVVNAGGLVDTVCRNLGTFTLTGFSPQTPPASWGPQPLVSTSGVVNLNLAVAGNNVLTISRSLATCSASDSRTIFVYDDPEVNITKSPANQVCVGQPIVLTANITNGVTAVRFEWFKDNIIIPNQNGPTLTITDSGSYTVATTGLGLCKKVSLPIVVKFNNLPTNGVTPSGILSPCSNAPIVLTADSGPGYTYQWFGLDSLPGETGITFIPTISGAYRVKVKSSVGCTNISSIVTVGILPAPLAPIIAPPFSDTCLQAGKPITITVGSSGAGLTFLWKKVGNPDRILAGNGPSITLDTAGSYYATVTASNGCFAISDTINLKQTIQISVQDTIIEKCVGDNPFVVSGLSPVLGCRILSNGVPLVNRIFTPSQPGNFILTYECANTNGCISTRRLEVRVIPLPSANLSVQGPTNVCQGDTVRLLVNDGNETGCSYQVFRNGLAFGSAVNTSIIPVTQPGNYSVLVTCIRCSTASNSLQVSFNPRPVVNIGENIQGCSPLITNLNVVGVSPGTWSGSPRITSTGDYNSGSFIGCDSVTLTVVASGNLCSNSKKKAVCVNPLPDFSIAVTNTTACLDSNGKAKVVNGNPGISFLWTKFGDPTILSVVDSIENVPAGVYKVRITSNFSLCFIEKNVIINSPNILEILIGGIPDSVCSNASPIQLIGNPTGGIFSSFGNRITAASPDRFDPSLPGPLVDTIYYTVKNGCVGTAKKSIKINAIPVLDAGPNASVCFGDTLVLRALQPNNQNLIWIGPQIQNDSLYIANDPGITSSVVSFGYTVNGCSNTASKTITVRPLPDFNLTTEDVTACGLSDGKVTVNILNPSQFQVIVRKIPAGTVIPPPRTSLQVGIYSIEVRNNTTACVKSETFGITGPTNINPFVCLSNVPLSLCQNEAAVTIGKCSPSATVYINGVATDTIKPAIYIPDNIAVILTDTDQVGCIGVEQKVVEIKAAPIVNVSGVGPLFACTNQNQVQLTGFFPAFDPIIPENGWTAPGQQPGFITRDGRINPSLVTGLNPIILQYTAKNDNGCSAFKTVQFNVYGTPVAAISPNANQEICLGTCTTLVSQNTDPNYTYTWYLGQNANPPPIGFGSSLEACLGGFYRLIVNNNGCKSGISSGVAITSIPSPIIASIGSDVTICKESTDFLIPAPVVVGTFTSAVWSGVDSTPAGFITAQGFVSPSQGIPGLNKVKFTVGNGSCENVAFRTFNIIPDVLTTITTSGPTTICEGDEITLTASATGTGYTYEWTRNGIVIADQFAATLIVSQAGKYNVRVIVNGIATCSKFQANEVEIIVLPSPVVTISGDSNLKVCFPSGPIDLNTERPFLPANAVWSSDIAGLVSRNGVLTPGNLVIDGVYNLILTSTIGNCTASDTLIVNANKFPDANFTQSAQAICDGDKVTLTYSNPNNYPTTWSKGGNVLFPATDINSIEVTEAGNYKLFVNNNGCTNEKNIDIVVREKPNFQLGPDRSACKNGVSIPFTPTPANIGGMWDGPGISPTGNWNPESSDVPVSGQIQISFTATSDFGCVTKKTITINVDPIPDIKLAADKSEIEIQGPAIITATGGVKFEWSPAETLNQNFGPVVSAFPSKTEKYFVRVTTDKGCFKDTSITILVDEEVKIYDAFSPNGDQKNNTWIIKNIKDAKYSQAIVRVFNRWGNLVFESEKGYPNAWDGSYDGKQVPPGAYYYIIEFGPGSGLKSKSGSVTVVR